MGIIGAAMGTGVGYCVSTITGFILFSQRKGTLRFAKPKITLRELGRCCYNGSSEMVTQLATAITMFILNITMMRYAGENGVAAATIIGNTQVFVHYTGIGRFDWCAIVCCIADEV